MFEDGAGKRLASQMLTQRSEVNALRWAYRRVASRSTGWRLFPMFELADDAVRCSPDVENLSMSRTSSMTNQVRSAVLSNLEIDY